MAVRWDDHAWAETEAAHREHYGACLGPCDHEECREAREPLPEAEIGDPGA